MTQINGFRLFFTDLLFSVMVINASRMVSEVRGNPYHCWSLSLVDEGISLFKLFVQPNTETSAWLYAKIQRIRHSVNGKGSGLRFEI